VLHILMNDPKVWHSRAEEARAIGEQMTSAEARNIMFGIAADYDLLATLAKNEPLKQ
jgi:hypothetical protein